MKAGGRPGSKTIILITEHYVSHSVSYMYMYHIYMYISNRNNMKKSDLERRPPCNP